MATKWHDLAFQPDEELGKEIVEAWANLVGYNQWKPFLCSMFGDVFFENPEGLIYWLSTSTADLKLVAHNRNAFDDICRRADSEVDEWFMPNLVALLHEVDKIPASGQCYCFIILPIFTECKFEPKNFDIVPSREVLVELAGIHKQLENIPDGGQVQIRIVD